MLMRTSCAGAGSFFQRRSLLSATITTRRLVMRPFTDADAPFVDFLRKEGLDFITATHDVLNVASGRVMERIGMSLRCSYVEHWMPKDYDVTFRMYQLDFKEGVETWKGYLH